MVDLDELERLLHAARRWRTSEAWGKDLCVLSDADLAAFNALRHAAAELIRDARRWREHEALLMRRAIDTEYQEPK